jgi:hypothetical protein
MDYTTKNIDNNFLIEPRNLFYCKTNIVYPPFKNGLYMEEFFLHKYIELSTKTKKTFIPALWTNFQVEEWFNYKKDIMQKGLDKWISEHPNEYGYFTIVQHDDSIMLRLPPNTTIYGACNGNIPLPLIYQDTNHTLENIQKIPFNQKKFFCSFVGSITANYVQPNVRFTMLNYFKNNNKFILNIPSGWTNNVNKSKQDNFIMITSYSRFALAPRGYGRSSFRFFEILQLGVIPIYIWNDMEWLPYKDEIDYSKFCISIHISKINTLEQILDSINDEAYNNMLLEYQKIKDKFSLDYMFNYTIKKNL